MRIVYDYSKRYCNKCEIVIDREEMDRHKIGKKHNLNYTIDKQMDHLIPKFIFEPLQTPPSTTRHATQ